MSHLFSLTVRLSNYRVVPVQYFVFLQTFILKRDIENYNYIESTYDD